MNEYSRTVHKVDREPFCRKVGGGLMVRWTAGVLSDLWSSRCWPPFEWRLEYQDLRWWRNWPPRWPLRRLIWPPRVPYWTFRKWLVRMRARGRMLFVDVNVSALRRPDSLRGRTALRRVEKKLKDGTAGIRVHWSGVGYEIQLPQGHGIYLPTELRPSWKRYL